MNRKQLIVVAVFLSGVAVVPPHALATAGKDKVVAKGEKAKVIPGWPEGVDKLINDAVRATGWHPWFSEMPNDHYYFEMDIRGPKDVDRLVKSLASVKAETVRVRLDPAEGARQADGMGAVFSLGTQPIIDRWFKALPEVEAGVRQFGVNRYREPPTAQPPTLTLYTGHKAVDLKELTIPANVDVTAPNAKAYRAKHKDAFRAIDEFIKSHRAQQKQAGSSD